MRIPHSAECVRSREKIPLSAESGDSVAYGQRVFRTLRSADGAPPPTGAAPEMKDLFYAKKALHPKSA